MRSVSFVMSECSLSARGPGHVSNFYIVDLENFATECRRYTGGIHNSTVVGLFMTPTRTRLARVTVECTCLLHIGPPQPSKFITSICSGLVMSECSLSGRGPGHVSNFYIVDFKKFATAKKSALYHGLRGSASPVLTATGFVNGRWQFSTPHRIHTP